MSPRLGPIAIQRARNARLAEQASRIAAADHARSSRGEMLPVIMLPANSRDTVPLPDDSREAFLEGLRTTVARVFAEPVRDNSAPMSAEADAARESAVPSGPEPGELSGLLGASCATCRGECCTAGGTHAFLRDDSLLRVRAQFADAGRMLSEEEVVAEYAHHLPSRHYRGSCVFHTPRGCELPRAMRSNLCNRYLCGGLTQLVRALDGSLHTGAYVAAADSVHLRRIAHVSPSATRTIPLT